ncbi:hypothetical protein ONS95_009295 [Cadophora gregata]|uniref:uncharacterized protein n=1 Tax=Cadophora gregata TaxID=51156 RepID=UPI0026DD3E8C|nr:uncharacterized protein ONS95_009295 [Cadophora gregata]KAK0124325.1 hypothetical protein ONS95_009295 [Cadophora gregata]KAK0129822.1 hypothetical protein ONS96_000371 [Cadophora gregata f. sp. sojae]
MASFNNQTQYSMLPRASEETDHDASPHTHLLPTSESSPVRHMPTACSITLSPVLILRIISFILALAAFIVFVVDGREAFIAADIFLALLMILNLLSVVQYSFDHVFKVTVELRQSAWRHDIGGSYGKTKTVTYADIGLSAALTLCLLLGNALTNRYYGGPYKAGVVVGYFVVLCQVLVTVPVFDQKSLTLTARLTDLKPKFAPRDNKLPTQAPSGVGGADTGSARRRATESEEPRHSPEELV